jgi:hypothetical protein
MNANVPAHLRKAHERLKDAEGMLSLSRYAGTVNRTYYVMFEAASALLSSINMEFDTHYGVKIKFGELFVKTGRVDQKFGRYFSQALELREDADYALDARAEVPRDVAQEQLRRASEFLKMAEEVLKAAGGKLEPGQKT